MSKTKRDGLKQPIAEDGRYYVADDRKIVGNCMLWWGPNSGGYTCEIREAGIYTGVEVMRMRETDVPWPVEFINARTTVHVRRDRLRSERSVTVGAGSSEDFAISWMKPDAIQADRDDAG